MSDLSMSGKLPVGDNNGLPGLLTKMLDAPKDARLVIGVLNVAKITTNADTGDRVPQLRWLAIEPVIDNGDLKYLQRLLERLIEARTGKAMLPLEYEQAIDAIEAEMGGADGESAA